MTQVREISAAKVLVCIFLWLVIFASGVQGREVCVAAPTLFAGGVDAVTVSFSKTYPDISVRLRTVQQGAALPQDCDVYIVSEAQYAQSQAQSLLDAEAWGDVAVTSLVVIDGEAGSMPLTGVDFVALPSLAVVDAKQGVGADTKDTLGYMGLWDALASKLKIVANAQTVVDLVTQGKVAAGIVGTEALTPAAFSKVRVASIMDGYPRQTFYAALSGKHAPSKEAMLYMLFLVGSQGQYNLRMNGFGAIR